MEHDFIDTNQNNAEEKEKAYRKLLNDYDKQAHRFNKILKQSDRQQDHILKLNSELEIAYKELEKSKEKDAELFKYKERYHSSQQENAFKKQLKIMRDDLSSAEIDGISFSTHYKPLDILSGDTYGTADIGNGRYFIYIIDAMGKGLSASITSIQSSSFLNSEIDDALSSGVFDFEMILRLFLTFIKKRLLDDEILSASFALIDTNSKTCHYTTYSMPPILVSYDDGRVEKICTKNMPIMVYFDQLSISTLSLDSVTKLLFYSDGLNENMANDGRAYEQHLVSDFATSQNKEAFIEKLYSKVSDFDDDLSIIYINFAAKGQ